MYERQVSVIFYKKPIQSHEHVSHTASTYIRQYWVWRWQDARNLQTLKDTYTIRT